MKTASRRRFINNLVNGTIGIGSLSILSFSSKGNKSSKGKKQIPVIGEFDICILGGSCTGVFAAVRAARLGASVAIVEKQNAFGGVATNGLVNIWHSLYNTEKNKQIIAGLTYEVIERLAQRDAVSYGQEDKRSYLKYPGTKN